LLEIYKKYSLIPVDEALRIDSLPFKITVNMMLEIAYWAQNQFSYEETEKIIYKIYNAIVNDDLIRKVTDHIGSIVFNNDTKYANQYFSLLHNGNLIYPENKKNGVLYIEIDGAAINTRIENNNSTWKENKLCVVFNSDNIRYWHNKIDNELNHKIYKREYTSFIGSADIFKKYVFYCALRNGLGKFEKIVLISDGAPWIRNLKEELFPEAQQILDFFHLYENLFSFAKFYFKKNEKKYIPWVEKYKDLLKTGYHLKVIDHFSKFSQNTLDSAPVNIYKYLLNNINNIDYKSYVAKNYFIGSGAIESGNKIVLQKRLKGPGMRWNIETAQTLLTLKAKVESDLWVEDVCCQTSQKTLWAA
jgi:hypothetical protein